MWPLLCWCRRNNFDGKRHCWKPRDERRRRRGDRLVALTLQDSRAEAQSWEARQEEAHREVR